MAEASKKETLGFQTEVKQLLNLMINSLYSNKEIFLRELISNASDAIDKLKFKALTNKKISPNKEDQILLEIDQKKNTITITDNGIGMSRKEVLDNLGTIAKSGTKEFFSKLSGDQVKDSNLIGQFGVGFYSSFMVAEEVCVQTLKAGEKKDNGVEWISKGDGKFSISNFHKDTHGTKIILKLKKDASEFLDNFRLKSIINKYSDHISIPILMEKEEWDKDKNKMISTGENEKVNNATALWTRAKNQVKKDQYEEFYKSLSYDSEGPLEYIHAKVEGKHEYTQLLYIPQKAPFDLWDRERKNGIKLYIKRVFIMDDADNLLPSYLRFVKGVVDTNDLPLNVSREILQQSKEVDVIKKGCTSKVLSLLDRIAKNKQEQYSKFWNEFGNVLKEGLVDDFSNKDKITKLLRFASTKSDSSEQNVSLDDYVSRMAKKQDSIYYVTADSYLAAKASPHLEIFKKKDIEVLLLHDRVDEWLVQHLTEFNGKKLVSVAKGNLDLGELTADEKKTQEKDKGDYKELIKSIKESLGETIKEVRLTYRLTDSPSCLVVDDQGMSMNFERLLKSAGQNVPNIQPILEINPDHKIIKKMNDIKDMDTLKDWSQYIYGQAMISEGGALVDPSSYTKVVNKIISGELS
ncbi:MAG: molecular chaperone HtpG [Hydrogenophilales bacterium]